MICSMCGQVHTAATGCPTVFAPYPLQKVGAGDGNTYVGRACTNCAALSQQLTEVKAERDALQKLHHPESFTVVCLSETDDLIKAALSIFEQAYARPVPHSTDHNNPIFQWMGQAREYLYPTKSHGTSEIKDNHAPHILKAPDELHARLDSDWTQGCDPWERIKYLETNGAIPYPTKEEQHKS